MEFGTICLGTVRFRGGLENREGEEKRGKCLKIREEKTDGNEEIPWRERARLQSNEGRTQ
eukprot:697994-Amorphochlora_amoeboformis.AAC.1